MLTKSILPSAFSTRQDKAMLQQRGGHRGLEMLRSHQGRPTDRCLSIQQKDMLSAAA